MLCRKELSLALKSIRDTPLLSRAYRVAVLFNRNLTDVFIRNYAPFHQARRKPAPPCLCYKPDINRPDLDMVYGVAAFC